MKRIVVISIFFALLIGCAQKKPLPQFEVQHPARLTINKDIKKVFIDPSRIHTTNDDLDLKDIVIKKLQEELNRFDRFEVIVGPVQMDDPEKDTVGLIQGDVISGEQVENGQFTEVATCKGGVEGFASGATAAKTSKQGVTMSRRGLPCKAFDWKSAAVDAGVGAVMSLAGVQSTAPIDEVIRVYKVKNISLFAQVNFSFTQIGKNREMIAVRSDSANFGRQIVKSAENVHEAYLTVSEAALLAVSPFSPLFVRKYAVVDATNRGTPTGRWIEYVTPTASNIPAKEREQVISSLVEESLKSFIRTVSPYKVMVALQIAESGNSEAVELIKKKEWKKARVILKKQPQRTAADEYNYGLTFEGAAKSADDYREAKKLYLTALNMEPGNIIYARGIGRMERRLKEHRKLQEQTTN